MTVIAVLGGMSGLVIVVLACVVWSLRGDVRSLSRRLAELDASSSARAYDDLPGPMAAARAAPEPVTVPVITHLSDETLADDDLEVTRARVASVTLARPLIKVAAFSHGVRRALDDERRMRIRWAMRQEFRRQRKMRRRRRAARAPSEESRP